MTNISLAARTRARNASTWLVLDFGGLMSPLASLGAQLDALSRPSIENFLAISDETWQIKEVQRDRTVELSQAEIDQDRAIADAKAAASRAKIAIERTADEYTLAARVYDATGKGLLMGAREFAALVEKEALAADAAKAAVDVEKEGLRQTKTDVEIQIEIIQQAQVAADLAKAQVEVAKAHVRAAMAGIEAGKAAVEVIETQVQVAMAEADKSTLQADVAMIFAEIVTKQLSDIELEVGKSEISSMYKIIASKLSDAIALYDAKGLTEYIKTQAENAILTHVANYEAAKQAESVLRAAEAAVATALANLEAGASANELATEADLRAELVTARNNLADARMAQSMGKDTAQTEAQALINAAHIATYHLSQRESTHLDRSTEYISGE